MKSPVPYFGSKQTIAPWIVSLLPPHEHYVEPFAGGLSVLLAKRPSRMETVNDLDGELVTFWRVLRERPTELLRACMLTPHSRAELAASWDPTSDELELARRIWCRLAQGRSGTLRNTGWRYYIDPAGSSTSMPGYLEAYALRLAAAAERLHSVSLEALHALEIIARYGARPNVLLYVDPPYLGSTRGRTGHRQRRPTVHDPLTVAFEIRRPWPGHSSLPAAGDRSVRWRIRLHHDCGTWCADEPPHRDGAFPWWKPSSYSAFWRLAGRDYYWPALIVVWHREPGGRDGLTECSRRVQRRDGTWRCTRGWRWHIHHWKLQFPPLQHLRRRLLTRCAWCGGPSRKGDCVNVSHQWGGSRGRWWQGEKGLFHHDCSSIATAHATCTCKVPVLQYGDHGRCAVCDRSRSFGMTEERLARVRELQAIPHGQRSAV